MNSRVSFVTSNLQPEVLVTQKLGTVVVICGEATAAMRVLLGNDIILNESTGAEVRTICEQSRIHHAELNTLLSLHRRIRTMLDEQERILVHSTATSQAVVQATMEPLEKVLTELTEKIVVKAEVLREEMELLQIAGVENFFLEDQSLSENSVHVVSCARALHTAVFNVLKHQQSNERPQFSARLSNEKGFDRGEGGGNNRTYRYGPLNV